MRSLRRIRGRHVLAIWLLAYFPWLPGYPLNQWIPDMPYAYVIDANLAGQYALIAFSLVILTGWVGQISLGQGAFVGVGAFTTGLIARDLGIPFPLTLPIAGAVSAGVAAGLGLVALRVRGLYLAVATLIFAWVCDAYLFSAPWFVGEGGASSIDNRVIGNPRLVTSFDLSNKRVFYLVMAAAVVATWYLAVNLRDSKTGRAFFAIRGSEMAAVSLGINVTRYKLLAFALSGGLAGMAGCLIMTDLRTTTPVVFQFTVSLFYLGIAVVGGVTSLGGAVAAGALFAALTEVFFRVNVLTGWLDLVTVGLLLAVLVGYPGGLGALGPATARRAGEARRRLASQARVFLERRHQPAAPPEPPSFDELAALEVFDVDELPALPPPDEVEAPVPDEATETSRAIPARRRRLQPFAGVGAKLRARLPQQHRVRTRAIDLASVRPVTTGPTVEELARLAGPVEPVDWRTVQLGAYPLPPNRLDRPPVLEADHVTVQFGGLRAVDDVSLVVREHEIVGLIGPNGAGKTTTFNAIAGLNEPTSGAIRIFGEDATSYPVHVRAQMGVGRTFQLIQLFPQLTVFDNLLVATHTHNPTGVFSHLGLTSRAIDAEAAARKRVRMITELLGLEDVIDRRVAGLPFGILRQVEIARSLVTQSPLLMLDEPASGLDNAETDELSQLLRYIRSHLGVTILLIEHDVRMVTAVTDYMYVVNRGKLLAEGPPAEIQRNPEVIAAYLGQAADAHAEPEAVTV